MLLSESRRRRERNSRPMTSDLGGGGKGGGGVRGDGFCFTPLLIFAAPPEVSYKCEELFQSPRGFRC